MTDNQDQRVFRKIRVISYVLRCAIRMRKYPAGDAYTYVWMLVVFNAQQTHMQDLLTALREGKSIPAHYRDAWPTLDTRGVVRVQGRLRQHPRLDEEFASPPLLTRKVPLAKEVAVTVHRQELLHQGGKDALKYPKQ